MKAHVEKALNLDRKFALLFVPMLLRTRITANQITAATIFLGLAGAILFAFGWPLSGIFLFILSRWMDHWDGEVARRTGTASFFGMCFDNAASAIIYSAMFVAVGLSAGEMAWTAAAVAGTILMRPVYFTTADDSQIKKAAWTRFGPITPVFLDEGGPPPYYLVAVFFVFDSMPEWVMICAIGYAAFTAWLVLEKYVARSFENPFQLFSSS